MLTLQPFVVNLSDLGAGVNNFRAVADKQFFESFDNDEILDSDVQVDMTLHRKGGSVDVACYMKGKVTVCCDLCLDPLPLDVEVSFEDTLFPEGMELDLRQDVYDYIITSLPLKKVHPEGQCNSDTTKYLCK